MLLSRAIRGGHTASTSNLQRHRSIPDFRKLGSVPARFAHALVVLRHGSSVLGLPTVDDSALDFLQCLQEKRFHLQHSPNGRGKWYVLQLGSAHEQHDLQNAPHMGKITIYSSRSRCRSRSKFRSRSPRSCIFRVKYFPFQFLQILYVPFQVFPVSLPPAPVRKTFPPVARRRAVLRQNRIDPDSYRTSKKKRHVL